MKRTYLWFGVAALLSPLAAIHPAAAQHGVPHMEDCTKWNYTDGKFGTSNSCEKPVVIQFMTKGNQHAVTRQLKPGEAYSTGLSKRQIGSGWWMFTTCPVGYVSNVPFLAKNETIIVPSKYRCVRK